MATMRQKGLALLVRMKLIARSARKSAVKVFLVRVIQVVFRLPFLARILAWAIKPNL